MCRRGLCLCEGAILTTVGRGDPTGRPRGQIPLYPPLPKGDLVTASGGLRCAAPGLRPPIGDGRTGTARGAVSAPTATCTVGEMKCSSSARTRQAVGCAALHPPYGGLQSRTESSGVDRPSVYCYDAPRRDNHPCLLPSAPRRMRRPEPRCRRWAPSLSLSPSRGERGSVRTWYIGNRIDRAHG